MNQFFRLSFFAAVMSVIFSSEIKAEEPAKKLLEDVINKDLKELEKPAGVGASITTFKDFKTGMKQNKSIIPPTRNGLIVLGLEAGKAFQEAKINSYDVIVAVNGENVTEVDQLLKVLAETNVGEKLTLELLPVEDSKGRIKWGKPKKIVVKIKSQKEQVIESIREKKDKVTGRVEAWHKHTPDDPRGTSEISFFFLVEDGKPCDLQMRISFTADDWLFIQRIAISTGSNPFVIEIPYQEWKRDNANSKVWEWCSIPVTSQLLKGIGPFLDEDDVTVRYAGEKFKSDRKLTANERSRLATVILAYRIMGGELPK